MKQILVISHSEDGTSKLLMKRLDEIGETYSLLDLSLFPKECYGTIGYSSELSFLFEQRTGAFNQDNVKSVWWRRPMGKFKKEAQDSLSQYIRMESDMFVRSLFYLLPSDVKWVSDPDSTRIANSKPLQLKVAQDCGLRIPKTVISNDPLSVSIFIRNNHGMSMIMKPVGTCLYRANEKEGGNRTIYTRVIDEETILKVVEQVKVCPVIFQEAILNKVDLRSTIVGDEVFTVSITHERDLGAGDDNLDWRNHKLERIYKPYELPVDVQRKLIKVVQGLGLRFGVADLCITEAGEYCFFEVNPQGQWGPSELVAGLPISTALANS